MTLLDATTYTVKYQWRVPAGKSVTHATINPFHAVISVSGGELLSFEIQDATLSQQGYILFIYEFYILVEDINTFPVKSRV